MKTSHLIALIGLPPLLACATTGAGPHEMSAEQHEAAAKQEEQIAASQAEQYHPEAAMVRRQCGPGGGAVVANGTGFCWTSVTNPTEYHRIAAKKHLKAAADHRAGSAALQQAEAQACSGIAAEDRDMSPFEHTEDIVAVAPLKDYNGNNRARSERLIGATITFRAVPGLTAEWFQRLIDCHLARNAALGHAVPEMPDCPLVPAGVEAKVTSTGSGFQVAVSSPIPASAQEILQRAQRLVSPVPVSRR